LVYILLYTYIKKSRGGDTPEICNRKQHKDQIAVILIDMQADFVKRIRKDEVDNLIESQVRIISFCADYDIPLIILEYAHHGETIRLI